ncbi:MAG: hypothetical protein RLZ87_1276 [Armatimonadota bacterium]|jgi:hypothetical protein
MDNLSRTYDDLKLMSVEYLSALKSELENIGTKRLLQIDAIENDNRKLMNCIKVMKYVPKTKAMAQKAQKEKQRERLDAQKEKKEIRR